MENYKLQITSYGFFLIALILTTLSFTFTDNNFSKDNINKIVSDTGILRTNSLGNILDGDMNDWDFNALTYKEVISKEYFATPFYKDSNYILTGELSSFRSEIKNNSVILTWWTSREKGCKGFHIERAKKISEYDKSQWKEIGFIECRGNSDSLLKYEFRDKALKTGLYKYRLKQIFLNGEFEYFTLANDVIIKKYFSKFQFYPAYPNPVITTSTISFYLPKKDTVSLYFLNGSDTIYILDHEIEERGFYKLTIDKNSLGFKNVIKRLYISCKSCREEKNFGDIQF